MTPYTVQETAPLYELIREATVITAALALEAVPDKHIMEYAKDLNQRLCDKLRELKQD